jgi:hypothetical protein
MLVIEHIHPLASITCARNGRRLVANILLKTMSIEEQTSTPGTSPNVQTQRTTPLTAANLAAQDRCTTTIPSKQAIEAWLARSENDNRRGVNVGSWTQLVVGDPLAAAIEDATQTKD